MTLEMAETTFCEWSYLSGFALTWCVCVVWRMWGQDPQTFISALRTYIVVPSCIAVLVFANCFGVGLLATHCHRQTLRSSVASDLVRVGIEPVVSTNNEAQSELFVKQRETMVGRIT